MFVGRHNRHMACYAACVAFCIGLILMVHVDGVPVFSQDWLWPLTKGQAVAMFFDAGRVWHEGNGGFASGAPNAVVAAWLLFGSAALLGPVLGLNTALATVAIVAFLSTLYYLRLRQAGVWAASAGAAIYASSPVLYNKIEAGHYFYLVGYATLPAALACLAAARKSSRTRAAMLWSVSAGVLLALGAGQFQFAAIAILVLGIEVASWEDLSKASITGALSIVQMIVLHAPDYAIMLSPQARSGFVAQETPSAWLISQSQSFLAAITSFRYIGGYAEEAHSVPIAWVSFAIIGLIALAIAAFVLCESWTVKRLLLSGAGLMLVGAVLVSGTDGPIGGALIAAFSHDNRFSAFRELYNFSVVTEFGLALLTAAACNVRSLAPAVILVTGAVVGSYVSVYLKASPAVTLAMATPELVTEARVLDSGSAGRRIAFTPTSPSVSLNTSHKSGVDSFAQPGLRQSAFVDTIGDTTTAYLFHAEDAALWSRMSVAAIVARPNMHSNYPGYLDPYSRAIASRLMRGEPSPAPHVEAKVMMMPPLSRRLRVSRDVSLGTPTWGNVEKLRSASHLVSVPLASFKPPQAHVGVDPLHDWTQSLRWYGALPLLSCLPAPTVFRITSMEMASQGATECPWTVSRLGNLECYKAVAPGVDASGPCIRVEEWRKLEARIANAVGLTRRGTDELVFQGESFDARWSLVCSTGLTVPPTVVLVDAYAIGWIVPSHACRGNYIAEFGPDVWFERTLIALWAMSLSVLIALTVANKRIAQ